MRFVTGECGSGASLRFGVLVSQTNGKDQVRVNLSDARLLAATTAIEWQLASLATVFA